MCAAFYIYMFVFVPVAERSLSICDSSIINLDNKAYILLIHSNVPTNQIQQPTKKGYELPSYTCYWM